MVTIRKADSTTSLLLFVYNNILTEFNRDSLKLSNLLEIMKAFGKNESATRMSLSRTVKAGLLVNQNKASDVWYTLASDGKNAINTWNDEIKRFWQRVALRHQPWDKKWHLLSLSFTKENRESRNDAAERLKQMGYGLLSTNLWIASYHQPQEVKAFLEEFSLKPNAVEMYGEIITHQDTHAFVESVFHLGDLAEPYWQFVNTFGPKFAECQKASKERAFVEEGQALPLMHALGWEFFFLAAEDAVLPLALQPAWAGDEAARIMRDYRMLLIKAVRGYLSRFM